MKNAVNVKNLFFGYEERQILKGIDLSIKEGRITTIIGPNGCGKTTLLRLMSNLNRPEKSSVFVFGKALEDYERKELARAISVLPQNRNTPNISVEKLVEHGRFPYLGMSRSLRQDDKNKVKLAIETVGITYYKDKNLNQLSGGERQKAYIAMLLAQDTPVIFLDEPTTYLDVKHQFELLNTVKKLNVENKKTIVMVLHDLNLAMKYSDEIIVLNNGKTVFSGTPENLMYEETEIFGDVFGVSCNKIELDGKTEYVVTQRDR